MTESETENKCKVRFVLEWKLMPPITMTKNNVLSVLRLCVAV
ncbi:hypothetical protein CCACVL1_18990 [Corchorus capsularis]|uniref:Uncharacterized protein n=1 Tax=Corchorus capsularis TaxID=210143 RepID=A0A1R3HJ26_COCAP|nr:hypothetical protein CCACVL1_18990 [Corchorus capsularis]